MLKPIGRRERRIYMLYAKAILVVGSLVTTIPLIQYKAYAVSTNPQG
jgi:hypothetical protein